MTPLDCLYAFFVSRLWSISATAYHLTLDWRFLRHWPPKFCARSQNISPLVVDGVINDIYGLQPTLPSSSLYFLYSIEAVTLFVVAVVGGPSPPMLPPTSQIEVAMLTCVVIGASVGLVGVISLFLSIRKSQ